MHCGSIIPRKALPFFSGFAFSRHSLTSAPRLSSAHSFFSLAVRSCNFRSKPSAVTFSDCGSISGGGSSTRRRTHRWILRCSCTLRSISGRSRARCSGARRSGGSPAAQAKQAAEAPRTQQAGRPSMPSLTTLLGSSLSKSTTTQFVEIPQPATLPSE